MSDLLELMDLNFWEMTREIVRRGRGGEIHETDQLTMCASPHGTSYYNMVLVRDAALDVDVLLDAIRGLYGRRGLNFSIGTREHADGALVDALVARGFMELVATPGMALLADAGTECRPESLAIRPVVDEPGRRDYVTVIADAWAVFQQPRALTDATFATLATLHAPHIQGFVGYAGTEPVAAATLYLTHGVAGVGWVGTVSAARGRRYAEAVTWAVVREGFRRGARFANLQASPFGRPVYERMGFTTPTRYRVLVGVL